MTNDADTRICQLWQQGFNEPPRFTPEDLRGRASRFERTVWRRNLREYIAAAVVVGVFAYYVWMFPTVLLRAGCGLIIAGCVYVAYQLHRRASARPAPAEMGFQSCLEFQRSELERQRDALKAVWSWYLLPFIPGMIIFLIGLLQFTIRVTEAAGRHFPVRAAAAGYGLVAACVAVVFVVIWLINQKAARKLQLEIDELDLLTRDSA